MRSEINFCQRCGYKLSEKKIEGKNRPWCPNCNHTVFLDPKIAAVVLVSANGNLVLVKRNIEPALGRWSFPSGYVDRGERVEEAAIREVKEETGLDVALDGFVGLYSTTGSPVVLATYFAHVIDGSLEAGCEVQEVSLFPPHDLPTLPFHHDRQILEDWKTLTNNVM